MARRTFSLVSSLMEGLSLQVLDTVEGDTPARAATSLMVTAINLHTSGNHIFITDFIVGDNTEKVNGCVHIKM